MALFNNSNCVLIITGGSRISPTWGGAVNLKVGQPFIILAIFSLKLHEIKDGPNWSGYVPSAPFGPANRYYYSNIYF